MGLLLSLGFFQRHHLSFPGYCGAQDTFYVGSYHP
jgi:hypothetical protein